MLRNHLRHRKMAQISRWTPILNRDGSQTVTTLQHETTTQFEVRTVASQVAAIPVHDSVHPRETQHNRGLSITFTGRRRMQ